MVASMGFSIPKGRFLFIMSLVYLFAFSSLYIQLPGLYGSNGVIPVEHLPNAGVLSHMHLLKLDSFQLLELCTLIGIIISFSAFVFSSLRTMLTYFLLWFLYLSVVKVKIAFLCNSDMLLLEAGFIAIMLTNFNSKSTVSDRIGMWLLRWLLFRINFSSGVINLMHDSSWWNLKGLHGFYQTQNLPSPLAWYISLAPEWVQKLILAASFVIRIVLPLLFFVQISGVRKFSFHVQIIQQIVIIILGNYGFLNCLVFALCYSLLRDDDFVKSRTRNKCLMPRFPSLLSFVLIGAVLGTCGYFLNLEFVNGKMHCSFRFTKKEFTAALDVYLLYIVYIAVSMFFVEICLCLFKSVCGAVGFRQLQLSHNIRLKSFIFKDYFQFLGILRIRSICSKLYEFIRLFFICAIGLVILIGSLFAFSSLNPSLQSNLSADFQQIYKHLEPFHIVNSYTLDTEKLSKDADTRFYLVFCTPPLINNPRVMRKISNSQGRLELILEGAPSPDGPWTEFEFYSKPGRVNEVPPITVPHLPRLDWQMWSITSGKYSNYPWFTNFVYRLLQKQPEVLQLLKPIHPGSDIRFIRGRLFSYQFTDNLHHENWWQRTFKSEYMPPMSLSSTALENAVRKSGLIGRDNSQSRQSSSNFISDNLTYLRNFLGQPSNLHPFVTVCFVMMLTRLAFNRASRTIIDH